MIESSPSGLASPPERERYDLEQRAENGLRRGYTTGACATAAVKAALLQLLCAESPTQVDVTLPEGDRFLTIPIDRLVVEEDGAIRAEVIKDGGDDPDQTHRARIIARVRRNPAGQVVFLRGAGVGLVTQPGMQISVGEPAINPVPRRMMLMALREVLDEGGLDDEGFDFEIGCERGEEIARRTFNPRLGIMGGISILGTTGIVEPKSMAAFKASIEIYIRVALGDHPAEIVLAPGNIGQRFARAALQIPLKGVVQMSNFFGFALECVENTLREGGRRLPLLWIIGHPGKLAKVLDDSWDTHSDKSGSALGALCREARQLGLPEELCQQMEKSNVVEAAAELLETSPDPAAFWRHVEARISALVTGRLTLVDRVETRLFRMNGTALGGAA